MDNIGVKGPKTDYNNKEVIPRIRKFILKYIQNLNKVLYNIEKASIIILEKKS